MSAAYVRRSTWKVDGLTFSGEFDSGRLGTVKRGSDGVFDISIPHDCEELHLRNEYRVWYFFLVEGGAVGRTVTLRIANLHQISKVYNSDLRPLVRVAKHSAVWERVAEPCDFSIKPNLDLQLTFQYTFVSTSPVYFAFYYPFTYTDCQRLLDNVDRALPTIGAVTARTDEVHRMGPGSITLDAVYYHRELLVNTPDGRRVELLTITSRHGILSEREPAAEAAGLFPRAATDLRPHRFRNKPGVFISARVHPAETAASYMVHGLIAFLLQPRNPYAKALRAAFVFKIIPMMNPDGVHRGHFRLDQFGVNLNRCYANPSPRLQPAVHGVRFVLRQMAALCTPLSLSSVGKAGRALNDTSNGLFMYLDLHAYSSKHGCYLLGNSLAAHKEARTLTFSHLLQLYSPQFNAFACSFGATRKKRKVEESGGGKKVFDEAVEAARRRMRASEDLAMAMMYGVSMADAPSTAPIAKKDPPSGPRLVKYSYSRPHVHAAEPMALALLAAALLRLAPSALSSLPEVTPHLSPPAVGGTGQARPPTTEATRALTPQVDTHTPFTTPISTEEETGGGEEGTASASPEEVDDSLALGALGVTDSETESGSVGEDVEDVEGGDKDSDGASTASEEAGSDDELEGGGEESDMVLSPSVHLGEGEVAPMLDAACRIFGLAHIYRMPEKRPPEREVGGRSVVAAPAGSYRAVVAAGTSESDKAAYSQHVPGVGLSVLPPSGRHVIDDSARFVHVLPDGVRSGPAIATLHDVESRKLSKEWATMKARLASIADKRTTTSTTPGATVGELKKGGTGRVRVHKEFMCAHSYTVECSCNLFSHAEVLHRTHMFDEVAVSGSSSGTEGSSGGKHGSSGRESRGGAVVEGGGLDPLVCAEYTRVFEQAYAQHQRPHVETSGGTACAPDARLGSARGGGGTSQRPIRIQCPVATTPYRSQCDTRSTGTGEGAPLPVRTITNPYMCQVDSIQPPTGAPSSSAAPSGSSSPAPLGSVSVSSTSSGGSGITRRGVREAAPQPAFVPPFGLPVALPSGVAPVRCTWGTCPHDPPSVFASVGRSVAFSILELIGATVAREPWGTSLNLSTVALHPLQSRLVNSAWGSVAGLHRWSRVMLDVETLTTAELEAAVLPAVDAPTRRRVGDGESSSRMQRGSTASSPSSSPSASVGGAVGDSLPVYLFSHPPPQNVDTVVFPLPCEAYWRPQLAAGAPRSGTSSLAAVPGTGTITANTCGSSSGHPVESQAIKLAAPAIFRLTLPSQPPRARSTGGVGSSTALGYGSSIPSGLASSAGEGTPALAPGSARGLNRLHELSSADSVAAATDMPTGMPPRAARATLHTTVNCGLGTGLSGSSSATAVGDGRSGDKATGCNVSKEASLLRLRTGGRAIVSAQAGSGIGVGPSVGSTHAFGSATPQVPLSSTGTRSGRSSRSASPAAPDADVPPAPMAPSSPLSRALVSSFAHPVTHHLGTAEHSAPASGTGIEVPRERTAGVVPLRAALVGAHSSRSVFQAPASGAASAGIVTLADFPRAARAVVARVRSMPYKKTST